MNVLNVRRDFSKPSKIAQIAQVALQPRNQSREGRRGKQIVVNLRIAVTPRIKYLGRSIIS